MGRWWWKVFALLACALVLSGCLRVQGSVNATFFDENYGVSVNNSIVAPDFENSSVFYRANATVCVYGERDERLEGDYFTPVRVFGSRVPVLVKWLNDSRTDGFEGCSVIVLRDDRIGQFVPVVQRREIARQVNRGSGLVVVGWGGTRAPEDASVMGWDAGFEGVVPARVDNPGVNDPQLLGSSTLEGELSVAESDPAFDGLFPVLKFDGWLVRFATPEGDAQVIAWIKSGALSANPPVYPGVIRACPIARNCAYYFSYDVFSTDPSSADGVVGFLAVEASGKYGILRAVP